MTISALNSTATLPTAALGSTMLPGTALAGPAAQVEKPGLLSRIGSALKAAVAALRGDTSSDAALGAQALAMQAPLAAAATPVASAPVTVKKPKAVSAGSGASKATAKHPKAKTWIDKAGNVRQVGTGKILKAASGSKATAAAAKPAATAATPTATQLPSNATQTSGATVYSYDQNGNPVSMSQLGITPTMLQGMTGLADAAEQTSTPQVNATNQNNIGLGSTGLLGSATPVLGQPILVTDTSADASTDSDAGTQSVTNENVTDIASRNQGVTYGGWY